MELHPTYSMCSVTVLTVCVCDVSELDRHEEAGVRNVKASLNKIVHYMSFKIEFYL